MKSLLSLIFTNNLLSAFNAFYVEDKLIISQAFAIDSFYSLKNAVEKVKAKLGLYDYYEIGRSIAKNGKASISSPCLSAYKFEVNSDYNATLLRLSLASSLFNIYAIKSRFNVHPLNGIKNRMITFSLQMEEELDKIGLEGYFNLIYFIVHPREYVLGTFVSEVCEDLDGKFLNMILGYKPPHDMDVLEYLDYIGGNSKVEIPIIENNIDDLLNTNWIRWKKSY
ncbi:MAG: hypothetical protein OWQ54_06880 [Sulfolobaceae archaeon]|nr:hypothetical protein [Sulfolobaceae archaeon]